VLLPRTAFDRGFEARGACRHVPEDRCAICRKTIGAKPIRADRHREQITLRGGDAGEEITSYRVGPTTRGVCAKVLWTFTMLPQTNRVRPGKIKNGKVPTLKNVRFLFLMAGHKQDTDGSFVQLSY
jgi:hypothetical protein